MVIEDERVTSSQVITRLQNAKIESRPAWKPMHMQPVFKGAQCFTYEDGVFEDEMIFRHAVCLPSGDSMTDAQQDLVITAIKACFNGSGD